MRRERESVVAVLPARFLTRRGGNHAGYGMDIHRTFAEAVMIDGDRLIGWVVSTCRAIIWRRSPPS